MDSENNPEFTGYLHAIGRRKALLFGVAIPIAVLAILLSVGHRQQSAEDGAGAQPVPRL